jgi:hypothetical protein
MELLYAGKVHKKKLVKPLLNSYNFISYACAIGSLQNNHEAWGGVVVKALRY